MTPATSNDQVQPVQHKGKAEGIVSYTLWVNPESVTNASSVIQTPS